MHEVEGSRFGHQFLVPPGRYTFCAESRTYGRAELTAEIKSRAPAPLTLEYEPVQTVIACLDVSDFGLDMTGERGRQRTFELRSRFLTASMCIWPEGLEWSSGESAVRFRVRPGIGAVKWVSDFGVTADANPPKGAVRWPIGVLHVYRTAINSVDFLCLHRPIERREVHSGRSELVFTAAGSSLEQMSAAILASAVEAETGKPVGIEELFLHYPDKLGDWNCAYGGQASSVERYYLRPGEVSISISSRGHATQWFQRTLMPGEETDLGTVRMEKERTIRGVVKGPFPTHASSVNVSAVEVGGSTPIGIADATVDWGVVGSAKWGEVGTFEIHGLSASTYLVGISRPYHGKPVLVSTTMLADPIQLETRSWAWVQVSSRRSDERFITVHIQDSDGRPVDTLHIGPTSDSHMSSRCLEYGAYNLLCDDGSTDLGTRTILVDRHNMSVVIE